MDPGTWISALNQLGQSTNGGFTVISLIALVASWLLYRGTHARFVTLERELKECNDKHVRSDKELTDTRRRTENISISTAALWTLINMSGDRRGYQLPPLNEVLEGRLVIQVRAGEPEAPDRRAAPPLVAFSDDPGGL